MLVILPTRARVGKHQKSGMIRVEGLLRFEQRKSNRVFLDLGPDRNRDGTWNFSSRDSSGMPSATPEGHFSELIHSSTTSIIASLKLL